jgi:gamma-glutamyltranspeptidase/glutathione hydrolase
MDYWSLPYPSQRQPVVADAVVATSEPLAAQAGLAMLQHGGNAVDAAIAAAAALAIVEPTSNGLGSDAFAIVAEPDGTVHGLNASGRSAAGLDPERYHSLHAMPLRGWDAVTVPGAVSGWIALHERFGSLELGDLLAPAIRWAEDGYPVGPVTAAAWAGAPAVHGGREDFAAAFLPGGRAPRAGERFALPDAGRTLRRIAETRGQAFYEGELAEAIAAHARAEGAALVVDDLAGNRPDWVDTVCGQLHVGGREWTVHELPPNGQGVAALIALGILQRAPVWDRLRDAALLDDAEGLHWQLEATKLAFAEVRTHVADPDHMRLAPADLLAGPRLDSLAARIDADRARDPGHGRPQPGGTVYLATGDAEGRAVSFIQSNYYGFGSGVVVPGTGISLQNRGAGFATDPDHPNAVAPGKRPFHTIIPAVATDTEGPALAFGVMGGPMQPQGHLQMLLRLAAGQNPQAASDAPRWRVEAGLEVVVERGMPERVRQRLTRMGHVMTPGGGMGGFGGAQLVARREGAWVAGSDHRKDGHAVGW